MNNIIFPNSFTVKPNSTMQLGQTSYKLDYVQQALQIKFLFFAFIAFALILFVVGLYLLKLTQNGDKFLRYCFAYSTAMFITMILIASRGNRKIDKDYVNQRGVKLEQTNFNIKPTNSDDLAKIITTGKNNKLTSYKIYANVKQNQKPVYLGTIKNNKINFSNNNASALLKKYLTFIKDKHLENDFKNNTKLVYDIDYLDQNNQPQLVLKGKNNKTLHLATYNNRVQMN